MLALGSPANMPRSLAKIGGLGGHSRPQPAIQQAGALWRSGQAHLAGSVGRIADLPIIAGTFVFDCGPAALKDFVCAATKPSAVSQASSRLCA